MTEFQVKQMTEAKRLRTADCLLPTGSRLPTANCRLPTERGFTLLEVILVLALVGIVAAVLLPSVDSVLAVYHLEQAGDDLQARLSRLRLRALEQSIPYAFAYGPETDQFATWACEPVSSAMVVPQVNSTYGTVGDTTVPDGDLYDRRQFELNDRADNREFRFLSGSPAEALEAMGLGVQARAALAATTSAESIASSRLLSQHKMVLATGSQRSLAALQIPGFQLGDMSEPVVFEADGTADRDAIIRIADRRGRYVEIMVHALSGAITRSRARSMTELAGALMVPDADLPKGGLARPSRSREINQYSVGAQ